HAVSQHTDYFSNYSINTAHLLSCIRHLNYSPYKTKSTIYFPQIKNFPLNTELEATITLVNSDGETGNYLQSVTPSTEAITVRMHHSFVQLPDKNYEPRVFDARSSFIEISWFDYGTPVYEPIDKYFII